MVHTHNIIFSSVQSLSRVRLFATPWIAARQASLSITNSRRSLRLTSIESVMLSSHLILCHPLLLLPPIPPSIRVFSNSSTLCMRMDWLDLLSVQGTLKSLLQHHSSKASILWCSAFLTVQLSHPYITTGKIIALTRWTFRIQFSTEIFMFPCNSIKSSSYTVASNQFSRAVPVLAVKYTSWEIS